MSRKLPRVKPGDKFTAQHYNVVAAEVERLGKIRVVQNTGLVLSDGPDGPVLSGAGTTGIAIYKTPVGGIPARSGTTLGSAACTRTKITGTTLSDDTATDTIYNAYGAAFSASKYIIVGWVGGMPFGLTQEC